MKLQTTFLLAILQAAIPGLKADDLGPEDKGKPAVVTGWVRDIACLMHYKKALKPENGCAEACARVGAPLVLVTADGAIYIPISTTIPDLGQRDRLMPYVGKYARVTGRVFEREGLKAIGVEKIEGLDARP